MTSSGVITITNTTASTTTSTGALKVSGGVGIGGALNVGGSVSFNDNTLRLNNNISSNNNDSGLIIPLYQVDNNTGVGDIVSGEAIEYNVGISAVTNNSLTLIAPIGTTLDYYKDWWIRIISTISGVNNQVRQITGFDHTTNTITLSSNFANNPVPNLSPIPGTTDSVNLYINRTSVASVWRGNGGFFGNIYTNTDSSTSLTTSSYANTRSSIATVDTLVVNTKKISFSVTGGGVSSYPLQTFNNAFLRFTNGRQLGMNYDGNDITMQWGAGGGYSQIRVSIGSSGFNTSLPTSITNTTVSSSSTTGALTVAGGMGINGALNIGGAVNIGGPLIVNNISTIIGTLNLTSTANNTTSYNIYQSWSNPATTAVECDMYINNTDVEFGTSTNHTLKLITNDTARLIITNSGNIGIENTSPNYKLDVTGDINLTGSLRFGGIALTSTITELNYLDLNTGPGTAEASKAIILDSNRDITNIRNLTSTTVTGTLQTAAQTNITSVGTLTGLTSSGAISITNIDASTSTTTGALRISGGVGIGGAVNIGSTLSVTGNITGTLATTSQPNITTLGGVTSIGASNATTITGILQTAAQTNITSVGTLTGLTSTGIVSITNTTDSTSSSNGALIVSGGVGISGRLNINNRVNIEGSLSITPTTKTISTFSVDGVIWHSNQDRRFGMRQIDNDSLALCWAGGGLYNDKIIFSETSGTTFNTAVTMTRGILEVAGTRTANNYDFGILGKRFQELENSSPTGDVVTDTANETYTTSTYNNTTPTITLPSPASTTTNFYQNWWIQILSGTGAGQVRKVSSSNSSRVLTLSGGAFTTPLSGSITIGLYAKEFAGIIWDESANQFAAAHTVTDTLTSNQLTITGYTDFKAKNISINSLALNDTSNYRTLIDCGSTSADKIIGLFNDGANNFYGFGASSSTLRIQTSGSSGGNVSFYTASTSSTLGTESMRIDSTKVSVLQTTTSTSTTTGALVISGGVGISGDTWIGGDIIIGTSGVGPNELRFAGTTGDTPVNYSVITERIYSGTEKSELLLFKGNDTDSISGPDRIRLRGSELIFQVHNNETYDTLADTNTVFCISNSQVGLFGKTTPTNTQNWLEVSSNGASGYSALFDGRVGIGTGATTPTALLHVKGSVSFTLPANSYGYYGSGSTNGSATGSQSISARFEAAIQVNSAVYISSDFRIKSNIISIDDNYCKNFILQLDPKKYKLNSEESDNLHFGYIAQDLIKHGYDNLINLVEDSSLEEHIDNTGFKSPKGFKFQISYSEIIPILSKNIKILYTKNDELEEKVEILESENQILKQQIQSILQRLDNLENN